jgi:hypothetical protein
MRAAHGWSFLQQPAGAALGDTARRRRCSPPFDEILGNALAAYRELKKQGYSELDSSAVVKLYSK